MIGRKFLAAALFSGLVLSALIAGCTALPDGAKSERVIAGEIWDCLDPETRAGGQMFFGGKEEMIQMLVDSATKDELIETRDIECGTGDEDLDAVSMTAEERVQATVEANIATQDAETEKESQRKADMYLQQTVSAGVATAMAPTPTPTATPYPTPTATLTWLDDIDVIAEQVHDCYGHRSETAQQESAQEIELWLEGGLGVEGPVIDLYLDQSPGSSSRVKFVNFVRTWHSKGWNRGIANLFEELCPGGTWQGMVR